MMYPALSVAKHIVTYCYQIGRPVSNLKLQKLLYYVWIGYFNCTKDKLFFEEMCAWQLGPVVPTVYYEFCPYAGMPIRQSYAEECCSDDISIIDEIVDDYIDHSAGELVSMTHEHGGPWDLIYKDGEGAKRPIPFDLIKQLECKTS